MIPLRKLWFDVVRIQTVFPDGWALAHNVRSGQNGNKSVVL